MRSAALIFCLLPAAAAAQPKFEFAKPVEKPPDAVEWKAQAKGGLVLTAGNSQTTTASLSGAASRKQAANRFALDIGATYGRSTIQSALDDDEPGMPGAGTIEPDEILSETKTTTNAWFTKARYDRFFTTNNSAYVTAQASADRPAGKKLIAGGQVGYSRQVLKTDVQLMVAELGYDFSHESHVPPPGGSSTALSIHSVRVFAGELVTITKDTGAFLNVEMLANLNAEKAPAPGYTAAGAFEDIRLLGKGGFNTTLLSNLSFGFSVTVKYDHAPAPRAPFKLPYASDFFPLAEKLDTIVDASLVLTFL